MEKPGDLSHTRHLANPCPGGGAGIVCIDPTTLSATPDPVHVRSGKPIHFFVNGGRGELQITFAVGAPVDQEGHEGTHVWARAKTVTSPEKHKYTIILDGRQMDPEVMIDP
jgi:hypothetical protein